MCWVVPFVIFAVCWPSRTIGDWHQAISPFGSSYLSPLWLTNPPTFVL